MNNNQIRMKKLFFIICTFCYLDANQVFGQEQKEFNISINLFNPYEIKGNDIFYIDNYLLEDFNEINVKPQIKKYKIFGLGFDLGYKLKNEDFLYFNFGLGQKKGEESLLTSFPNPANHPDEVVNYDAQVNFKQLNYNFSLFYQTQGNIKKMQIFGGLGFSYLLQGKSKYRDIQIQTENVYPNQMTDSLYQSTNFTFANGHSLGLGLRLGVGYNLNKNFRISADFTSYVFYTFYAPKSLREFHYYERRMQDDGGGNIVANINQDYTISQNSNTDFKLFNFTNISPSIKITYTINMHNSK